MYSGPRRRTKPDEPKEAVRKTIEKFERIDFVIYGEPEPLRTSGDPSSTTASVPLLNRCWW